MNHQYWLSFLFLKAMISSTVIVDSMFHQNSLSALVRHRQERDTLENEELTSTLCERFSKPKLIRTSFGADQYHILSPNNPLSNSNIYPPSLECFLIIEAPSSDKIIYLDFRNYFHMEPSETCEHDYLEIRDGKYGFSDLIKTQFCGDKFPDDITSSGKYLWLHFKSDESIEFEGFHIIYEFRDRDRTGVVARFEEDECFFTKSGQEGNITRADIGDTLCAKAEKDHINLDCLWMIEVDNGSQIMLTFQTFDLQRKNECERNYVSIHEENTNNPVAMKTFCGSMAESVESKTNILYVRFFADYQAVNASIVIWYTAFRKKQKKGECVSGIEIDCGDDTCISKALECNERYNCKFQNDESNCNTEESKWKDLIVILCVFGTILGAMTSIFLFNCIRKLIHDQRIIREHIRQSKESRLDEIGRLSAKRSMENINRINARPSLFTNDINNLYQNCQQSIGSNGFPAFNIMKPTPSTKPPMNNYFNADNIDEDSVSRKEYKNAMTDTTDSLLDARPRLADRSISQQSQQSSQRSQQPSQQSQRTYQSQQSQARIDVRNSAPDVIIITSNK